LFPVSFDIDVSADPARPPPRFPHTSPKAGEARSCLRASQQATAVDPRLKMLGKGAVVVERDCVP
jgi:hypothetical protein